MKKLMVLVGIMVSFTLKAELVERALMEDYVPVADRDFAFEVKTKKFDKVILDCGGFVGWMTFYRSEKIVHNVYMDTYSDCPNMHDFLNGSKQDKKPVCLSVAGNSLTVSNEESDCQ
jgi:hypothetical protein